MEKFFEKLSSYNLLNNLLPGAVFCYLLKYFFKIDIMNNLLVENLFFFYFCGMVISRVGSIIIEPIYRKLKIVHFADYSSFLYACKNDSKIEILSETNNTYRTFLALIFILLIIKGYIELGNYFTVLFDIYPVLTLTCLILLFTFSYRKQVEYISKRIKYHCEHKKD